MQLTLWDLPGETLKIRSYHVGRVVQFIENGKVLSGRIWALVYGDLPGGQCEPDWSKPVRYWVRIGEKNHRLVETVDVLDQ